MRRHIGNGLAVLAGQGAAALGSILGVRLLTEYLLPAEYGHLMLGLTLTLVVNQLLMGPFGAGITRFYSTALEKKESAEFLAAMLRLSIIITGAVILIAVLVMAALWGVQIEEWVVMVAIATIFSLVSGLNSVINSLWLGDNHQVVLSLIQGLEPWLRMTGGLAAVFLVKESGQAAFAGYIAGIVVLLLIQIYLIRRHDAFSGISLRMLVEGTLQLSSAWQSKVISYSYPFAIWGIFTTLHMASDRWILQWYHGTEEVGHFAVLYQIGYMPMTLLTGMGAQLLTPILFSMAGEGADHARINKVISANNRAVWASLMFLSLAAWISWLFSELALDLLSAEGYRQLHIYLPLFVIAGGLFGAGQVAALGIQSQNRTRDLLKIKLTSAIIGVASNLILVPFYGAPGVGISLGIFAAIYLLWLLIDTRKTGDARNFGQT